MNINDKVDIEVFIVDKDEQVLYKCEGTITEVLGKNYYCITYQRNNRSHNVNRHIYK